MKYALMLLALLSVPAFATEQLSDFHVTGTMRSTDSFLSVEGALVTYVSSERGPQTMPFRISQMSQAEVLDSVCRDLGASSVVRYQLELRTNLPNWELALGFENTDGRGKPAFQWMNLADTDKVLAFACKR